MCIYTHIFPVNKIRGNCLLHIQGGSLSHLQILIVVKDVLLKMLPHTMFVSSELNKCSFFLLKTCPYATNCGSERAFYSINRPILVIWGFPVTRSLINIVIQQHLNTLLEYFLHYCQNK